MTCKIPARLIAAIAAGTLIASGWALIGNNSATAVSSGAALDRNVTSGTGTTLAAPYVDIAGWPTPDMVSMSYATGLKAFTAAFIVQESNRVCSPAWGAYSAYVVGGSGDFLSNITATKNAGARVIVSFGGAANSELAINCTTDSLLLAAYKKVIDRYGIDRIDFDIEGAAVSNSTANQRRARVVAQLQADYAAAGHPVEVSLTLPVMPTGLIASGIRTVKEFAAAGVKLAQVNVMAMDYGTGVTDMGAAAISAATRLVTQLKAISQYSALTTKQLYAMVGITPMIGRNDISTEVFTVAHASKVAAFAKAKGVGELSWWSMTRDKPCTNRTEAVYLCTHVSEPIWAFSKAFFTGIGGVIPTSTPGPTATTSGCPAFVQPYAGDLPYGVGSRVTFEGQVYISTVSPNWWSPAAAPTYWYLTTGCG